MSEFTKGPWRIIGDNVYGADAKFSPFTDSKGEHHPDYHSGLVALVYRDTPHEANGANARLIAAAPEMFALVACTARAAEPCVSCTHTDCEIIRQARALHARIVQFGPHAHAGVWISRETADNISRDGA